MSDLYEIAGVPVDLPTERPLKVFISYRHAEMPGTAWALYLGLKKRFGAEYVFLDNSTLHGGMQWLDEIRSHVAAAGAFIVLIGPNLTQSLTADQQRGDVDWVAKEIDLANYLVGRTSLMYCAISARSGNSGFSLTLRPPANWPRPE